MSRWVLLAAAIITGLCSMISFGATVPGPPSFGIYSTESGKIKAPRPNSVLHIPLATYSSNGRMIKEDKRQITPPALKRQEFYGPRGVTLNSVGGYAFAKWRNYGDTWSTSLDRVAFGMRKAAELGMTTVTDWAVPGNFYTDYRVTYLAAGDFTNRNFASDDWSALDLTMQLARQNKMQVVLRIPNGGPVVYGDTPTKYSSTDYLNKYLKPLWGYIATRYADYDDVIACIDWGFEVGIRYTHDSTFFSNSLTERVPYELADEWVSTHVALRSHIQSIAPGFAVALPSTYDWVADGAGQSVKQMLDHLNAINPSYVNAFDRYALIDYYSNWDNPTLFSMINNDPLDDGSYWGNTSWLTDGTWDEITQESVDALDSYGRTDVMLAAPEGGHYLMLQDTYNMTAGSGTVTLSLGGHNFLTTEYLSVGETVFIGNDGVEYTITALGLGTPAGSEMTVTPVSADNKSDVRIYRKEKETDQYWSMRWLYKKIAQTGSRWGFFNWFMFWDNSTNFPLDYPHYRSPGVSVYAQQGVGFVESDTLKETVRASVVPPKPVDMQWFPKYMSNDKTKEQLTIDSSVNSTVAAPSLALEVKKTFEGGRGGVASFENDYTTAAAGVPMLLRRSKSGGAVDNNTGGGSVRFQFHNGVDYLNRCEVVSNLLDTVTGASVLKFSTSQLSNPSGGVTPALIVDEHQNVHIRSENTALNTANSAKNNLIFNSALSASPSAPVADSVALHGADMNGAGTTGLKLLTEDNHTFELGTKAGGTGLYIDGTKLTGATSSGSGAYVQLAVTGGGFTHDANIYRSSLGVLRANDFTTDTYTLSGVASTADAANTTANTVNTRIPAPGAAGYVPFGVAGTPTTYSTDAAFFWDNTNKRLGIGTTSPVTAIDVSGTTAINSRVRITNTAASASNGGGAVYIYQDDGAAVASGDRIGYFLMGGSRDASHTLSTGAYIAGFAAENWSSTSAATDVAILTTNSGATAPNERIRIASNGLVTNSNGGGVPFGSMYTDTALTITVSSAGVWYEVNTGATDFTAGLLKNVTQSDHYMVATTAGYYEVEACASLGTGVAGHKVALTTAVNDTATSYGHGHTTIANAASTSQVCIVNVLSLTAGQEVSLMVQNHSGSVNIDIDHAQAKMKYIGSP